MYVLADQPKKPKSGNIGTTSSSSSCSIASSNSSANNCNNSNGDKTKEQEYDEAVRDLKITWMAKYGIVFWGKIKALVVVIVKWRYVNYTISRLDSII